MLKLILRFKYSLLFPLTLHLPPHSPPDFKIKSSKSFVNELNSFDILASPSFTIYMSIPPRAVRSASEVLRGLVYLESAAKPELLLKNDNIIPADMFKELYFAERTRKSGSTCKSPLDTSDNYKVWREFQGMELREVCSTEPGERSVGRRSWEKSSRMHLGARRSTEPPTK